MIIVAFLLLLYAYNVGWTSIQFAEEAREAVKWPVVEGTVRVFRGRKSNSKHYEYSVSGRTYRGSMFHLPSYNPFVYRGLSYKDGQHVLVYFDPTSPEKSSICRSVDESEYNKNLMFACVAVVFGISAFGCFVNDMTSHKAKLGLR